MSTAHSPIECGQCGVAIDVSVDTVESRRPCPACGSVKRAYFATMTNAQPSNYLLDNHIAHKLSALIECGAAELKEDSSWLNNFILNSTLTFHVSPNTRAYLFSFLRRTEGATTAYRLARTALIEHIGTPRNVVSPYFRALTQFEICISQCYQGYALLATAAGQKVYSPDSKSAEANLHTVYVDSKHMDLMISGKKLPPEATTGVWITNSGLESSRGSISFPDLHGLLSSMHSLAEQLSSMKRQDES